MMNTTDSDHCSCSGLNVTCGLHQNTSAPCMGMVGVTNGTNRVNETLCDGISNYTDCMVTCEPIGFSVSNVTEYHCNCTVVDGHYSTSNSTTLLPSGGSILTTTAIPPSSGTLPFGQYCGLLGDELPLVRSSRV